MAGHEKQGSDMGAAFTGLIGGLVFLGAIIYGIVLWTNARFESHHKAKAAVTVSTPTLG